VQRVFHPVAVHFKGSGFYTTDYGKKAGKGSKDGGSSDSKSSESSNSSDSKKKDDKKASAKSSD
jgi:predicted nucleic acid-binding Zn ribbon protein